MQPQNSIVTIHSWRDVVSILMRHGHYSAIFFLATCSLVGSVILFAPRKYRSTAKYLIRFGHEAVATGTVGESAEVHRTSDSIVKSVQEILLSETVADRVVQRMGTDAILNGIEATSQQNIQPKKTSLLSIPRNWLASIDPTSDLERAIITFQQGLKVSTPSTSNVVVATYSASTPKQAFIVMQTLSEIFLEEHSRVHRTVGSYEFLLAQNKVLTDQMNAALEKLNAAKNRYCMGSVDGKRANVERRIDEAEAGLLANARSTVSSQTRVQQLEFIMKDLPELVTLNATSGVDDQTSAGMRQKLYELEIREKEMLSKYNEDHPNVKAIRKQLEDAKLILAATSNSRTETNKGINPIHQSFSVQLMAERTTLASAVAEKQELERQLKNLHKQLSALNDQEVEITQLATDADLATKRLESHAVQLERARLELELSRDQITSIGVIEQPRLHERPSFPTKKLIGILGLLFAIGGAFSLPFVLEYVRDGQTKIPEKQRAARSEEDDLDDIIEPSFVARERVTS